MANDTPSISRAPAPIRPIRTVASTPRDYEPTEACFDTDAWSDRLSWPDDAKPVLTRGIWAKEFDLVFFARAVLTLAEQAPISLSPHGKRLWAANLIVEKCIQGDLGAYERQGRSWPEIPSRSWEFRKKYELPGLFSHAGSAPKGKEQAYIYLERTGLTRLVERARLERGEASGGPRTIAAETRAESALEALAREHVENGAPVPVRAAWKVDCGLGTRAADRVWRAVAKKYPAISSLNKPKRKRGA